ncbi:hypothetical protein EON80_18050 [bacterium]|nr:MAG: hypothetical protein EON80_18050 [bacterium]
MNLYRVTDQGSNFDDCEFPILSQEWLKALKRVHTLFRYLEQHIEGPPQWVTCSHGVQFYLLDDNDWRPEKARVFVDMRKRKTCVRYRCAKKRES